MKHDIKALEPVVPGLQTVLQLLENSGSFEKQLDDARQAVWALAKGKGCITPSQNGLPDWKPPTELNGECSEYKEMANAINRRRLWCRTLGADVMGLLRDGGVCVALPNVEELRAQIQQAGDKLLHPLETIVEEPLRKRLRKDLSMVGKYMK